MVSATPSSRYAGRSPAPTPAALRIEGQTLALDPVGVEVDVVTFERRVAEGTPAGAGAGGRALPRGPAPGLHRERAALRGVARRRAGAAAGDGAGGPGAAAGRADARPRARSAPFRRRCGCSGSIPCRRPCTARSCGSMPARGGGERRSSSTRCASARCSGSWGQSPRRRRGSSIRNCFGARPRWCKLRTLERTIALAPRGRSGRRHPISPRRRRRCSGGRRSSGGCDSCSTRPSGGTDTSPPWWARRASARRG